MTTKEEVCVQKHFYVAFWFAHNNNIVHTFSEYGGFGSVSGKIEADIKINHEGEVNR